MTSSLRNLYLGGLFAFCLVAPKALPAASGCTTSQLFGVYDVQSTNLALQNVIRPIASVPPTTTNAAVVGFLSNPASLGGNTPGLGRYYLDSTGNVTGVTAASSTSPSVGTNVGTYTVNADCSGRITFTSGAAYDIYLAQGGTVVDYLRTDASGGGEVGVLQRSNSCVNLQYGGSFSYVVGGGNNQTTTTGGTTTTALAPYSIVGAFTLNGTGGFSLSQSVLTGAGVQRSTAIGSYTVGNDCSIVMSFSSAAGSNSTNFVAPSSFRVQMSDSNSGFITYQPNSTTTLTGTVNTQASFVTNTLTGR